MAEDLDNQDIRAEQMDNLMSGDTDAYKLKDVDDISDKLRRQMDDAGKVFNKDDRERWERKIASAKGEVNIKELEEIQRGIEKERARINQITPEYLKRIDENAKYFTKDSERKIDTAQEFKDRFIHASVAERDKMFAAWEPSIENRKRIFTELAKHLGSEADVGKLRHRERSAKLDEIEKNLAPHRALEKDYALYPAKYRAMVPDFRRRTLESKKEGIGVMNKALDGEYAEALKAGDKVMTKEELKEAKDHFATAPLTGPFSKFKALDMLKKHIEDAKDVNGEFDEELKDMPDDATIKAIPALNLLTATDYKKKFAAERFENKKELIAELKKAKLDAEGKMDDMYEATLNDHEDDIGPVVYKSFLAWFKQRGLKDKAHAYEQAENPNNPDSLMPRVKTGERFRKEVSTAIKADPKYAAIIKEFKESAGGGRRQEILTQLLNAQKEKGIKAKPEETTEQEAKNQNQQAEGAKPVAEPTSLDQIRATEGDTEFLNNMTDEQLQAIIKMGMQAESIKKDRELATIYSEAAASMARTEKTTGAIKQDARRGEKDKALADIEDELMEHSTNEGRATKILDGETGESVDVLEVDAHKAEQMDATKIHNMTHQFAEMQMTEKGQLKASRRVRIINQSKQEVSSDALKLHAQDMKAETDEDLALRTARKLSSMGKKVGGKDLKRLEEIAEEADTKVRLEKRAA